MKYNVGMIINIISKQFSGVIAVNTTKNEIGCKTEDQDLLNSINLILSKKELIVLNNENFDDFNINYKQKYSKTSPEYINILNYYLPSPYRIVEVNIVENNNIKELLEEMFSEKIENEVEDYEI